MLNVTINGVQWQISEADAFRLEARPSSESVAMVAIDGGKNTIEKVRKIVQMIRNHPDYK